MVAEFSADLYPREVIIKTAYAFTDNYYVHLDLIDNKYKIELKHKADNADSNIEDILNNEIIDQLARYTVSVKTAEIRKLIMGRAFASSMIVSSKDMHEYSADHISSSELILRDWFETHDN